MDIDLIQELAILWLLPLGFLVGAITIGIGIVIGLTVVFAQIFNNFSDRRD